MGVYRTRIGSVGRPFRKGNPGGGRPKGVPNKSTLEMKEFGQNFLTSERYRRNLMRRILAGSAPHMEVLGHHYAFGKPKHTYVPAESAAQSPLATAMDRMTSEEVREMSRLMTKMREIQQQALARPAPPSSTESRPR